MERRTFLKATLALTAATTIPLRAFAQVPVSFWYEAADPGQQGFIKSELIEKFNKAHPEYKLVIDYRGNEIDKQMRVALLSGSGPDVVLTAGPSYVAPLAQAGQLLGLDDYAEKFDWNKRVLPVFLEMGKYEGKLYSLPKTYETLGLFYNKTLFDKHGWSEPKTLAEVERLADKMLAEKIIPFAAGNANWRPANEHYVSIVLNAVAGPENVYKALKGELPWTAEPFVKAIDKLNSWWQKGYFGPNYFSLTDEQAFAMMASGQAGMMPTGTWQFQRIGKYFPANKAEPAFIAFPTDAGIEGPVYPLGIGSTLSIAAKAQNPDGAAEVLNYIFSDDFYGRMNSVWQGEWNLPLEDLTSVKITGEQPLYEQAMKTLANAVSDNQYGYTTWTFLPPATDAYLVNGIEEVWLGRAKTAQFLEQLDTSFKQEMAEGKVPAVPAR